MWSRTVPVTVTLLSYGLLAEVERTVLECSVEVLVLKFSIPIVYTLYFYFTTFLIFSLF